MIAGTEAYLKHVNWLKETRTIPEWDRLGIPHGFEGKGFELPSEVAFLNQVHGDTIVRMESAQGLTGNPAEGDGYFSTLVSQKIAVKTADCIPVLIAAPQGVMALHAGWKGLAQNIVGKALSLLGQDFRNVSIAIGPCIGRESFEIGPEVVSAFRSQAFHMNEVEFAFSCAKGVMDRWHLDLATLCVLQLQRFELPPENVHVVRTCTKRRSDLYHSYRRDAGAAGRNWSWIAKPG